jgi:hypothetical protein
MILKPTDKILCPNPECTEEWEGEADDYAIAGRTGVRSEAFEQCGYCYERFNPYTECPTWNSMEKQ